MRAAPRIALLCLTLPRAFLAADTADIDFLNLQGDIRIAKKERQNLERKVDAQNGDLARRLEAACGAASIGQAHVAKLRTGEAVVVKVQ